jgi:hypothetical protein
VQEDPQPVGGLLGDDTVAEGLELGAAGKAGHVDHVARGEAHHPFDERGAQTASLVVRPGGRASEDVFPAAYSALVVAPREITAGCALFATLSGRNSTSSASVGPCPPALLLSGCCDPPFTASCAVGVFSSRTFSCRPSFPPVFQSLARGVGRFAIRARRVSFLGPSGRPGPVCSFVVGVGSSAPGDEDDAFALVAGADFGSAYDLPFRMEPEAGQVAEYSSKCPQIGRSIVGFSHAPRAGFQVAMGTRGEETADILNDHQ